MPSPIDQWQEDAAKIPFNPVPSDDIADFLKCRFQQLLIEYAKGRFLKRAMSYLDDLNPCRYLGAKKPDVDFVDRIAKALGMSKD